MSSKETTPKPPDNPFLRVIHDETHRLGKFAVAGGHLADVLGEPLHMPKGEAALQKFAKESGLTVEVVNNGDGAIFTAPKDKGE